MKHHLLLAENENKRLKKNSLDVTLFLEQQKRDT